MSDWGEDWIQVTRELSTFAEVDCEERNRMWNEFAASRSRESVDLGTELEQFEIRVE